MSDITFKKKVAFILATTTFRGESEFEKSKKELLEYSSIKEMTDYNRDIFIYYLNNLSYNDVLLAYKEWQKQNILY
jgi:hypothetical protein